MVARRSRRAAVARSLLGGEHEVKREGDDGGPGLRRGQGFVVPVRHFRVTRRLVLRNAHTEPVAIPRLRENEIATRWARRRALILIIDHPCLPRGLDNFTRRHRRFIRLIADIRRHVRKQLSPVRWHHREEFALLQRSNCACRPHGLPAVLLRTGLEQRDHRIHRLGRSRPGGRRLVNVRRRAACMFQAGFVSRVRRQRQRSRIRTITHGACCRIGGKHDIRRELTRRHDPSRDQRFACTMCTCKRTSTWQWACIVGLIHGPTGIGKINGWCALRREARTVRRVRAEKLALRRARMVDQHTKNRISE